MDRNKLVSCSHDRWPDAHYMRSIGLPMAGPDGRPWTKPYTYRPRDGGPHSGSVQPSAPLCDNLERAPSRGHLCNCTTCAHMWGKEGS